MTKQTVLHATHLAAEAKMVDFGGWDMPIHYGSQIEEHHAVRQSVGLFDVSHMTVVDLRGDQTQAFLRVLLANNIDKLKLPGRALYTCMLNQDGGVIDDLIVYWMGEDHYRLVVNASTREKDLAWISQQAKTFNVDVLERSELAMIAVQGPEARKTFVGLLEGEQAQSVESLVRFSAYADDELFVGRTGYTGEDGFEIVMPEQTASTWWARLVEAGARPCGLGARDTLRLEAGMNLYGQDMDETTGPYESALAWTVDLSDHERQFIGRDKLEQQKAAGIKNRLVALVLTGRGVLRHGQQIFCAEGEGVITSGTFSPSLSQAIAFARIPRGASTEVEVDIRGKRLPARIVKAPFVRDGKACAGIVA